MNYMKEVAQMLGVELDEEFYTKGYSEKYKITKKGMYVLNEDKQSWFLDYFTLSRILNGNSEIIKSILTKEEKEYLSVVIRPFRDRVKYLFKGIFRSDNSEFIAIAFNDDDIMFFPSFEVGIMYEGMELEKEYTKEDLGL